jgi:hypothetical protein
MVCRKLRDIYHPTVRWFECYQSVATKFIELKKIVRKFYPDKTEVEILMELAKYSNSDLKDVFTFEIIETNTPKNELVAQDKTIVSELSMAS